MSVVVHGAARHWLQLLSRDRQREAHLDRPFLGHLHLRVAGDEPAIVVAVEHTDAPIARFEEGRAELAVPDSGVRHVRRPLTGRLMRAQLDSERVGQDTVELDRTSECRAARRSPGKSLASSEPTPQNLEASPGQGRMGASG